MRYYFSQNITFFTHVGYHRQESQVNPLGGIFPPVGGGAPDGPPLEALTPGVV